MEEIKLPDSNDEGGGDKGNEGDVLDRNVSENIREYLKNTYGELGKPMDSLRSAIFHFPEFSAMKQDELELAIKMFDYVIRDIVDKFEEGLESISQRELADTFTFEDTVEDTTVEEITGQEDLYDERTANYVAGQVISAVKRIISEQEKKSP